MLLALNAFKIVSAPPPVASRTSIGLLLALTRPIATGPVEPPVEPSVPPATSYTGGASRGRMIRKFGKRKREELEELLEALGAPVEVPVLPPVPSPPALPPQPGLMANVPTPPITVLRSPPDEDEDEIALLLELIS
jgi:hypothetical protein